MLQPLPLLKANRFPFERSADCAEAMLSVANFNPAEVSSQPSFSDPERYSPFAGLAASHRRFRTVSILI